MTDELSIGLQYLVIAVAVVVSLWVVLKKQFPGTARKWRIACALLLLREGRAPWLRRLGRWIAPPGSAHADGCGGCERCETDDKR